MKFDWEKWNLGGRIIFVSVCIAALSMLMNWVDVGFASSSGLSQGTFLFLGFWVYPVLMLFKNKDIKRLWGLACPIAAAAFTLVYISSKTVELFGESRNAAAGGAWLFLLTSIVLVVGVLKYNPADEETTLAEDDQDLAEPAS